VSGILWTKTSFHPKSVAIKNIAYSRTEKCSKYSINHPEKVYLPPLDIELGIIKISSREGILRWTSQDK
jgi:hypothetical protein